MNPETKLLCGAIDELSSALRWARLAIAKRITELAKQHGGLRKAAKAIDIDPGYLCLLRSGKRTRPSAATLRKLGLAE